MKNHWKTVSMILATAYCFEVAGKVFLLTQLKKKNEEINKISEDYTSVARIANLLIKKLDDNEIMPDEFESIIFNNLTN